MPIDYSERQDVLVVIRHLFSDGVARIRARAIPAIARSLGYGRTGARIHNVLNRDIMTAVRRGILVNEGGQLSVNCRSIEHYEREFLKQQLLAALGRTWIPRADAPRLLARWLGFARTGGVIERTTRSLINGLIRTGRVEADAERIRRAD
ncbi:MAG: hypothetical protein ABIZ36_13800 [Gemmatimonadaceae bacterium]